MAKLTRHMPWRAAWRTAGALTCLVGLALLDPGLTAAQDAEGTVVVRVVSDAGPVAGATVRSGEVGAITDREGVAVLRLAAGDREISARRVGFEEGAARATVVAGRETSIEIAMAERAEELEAIVVTSTRTENRIEDEPVRVEVLSREEVEEKMMMTPGDIAMMLNETSGLRVQNTSPSLGGANVRIQGLRGRYTQILSDGLPLYGGQSGSLSMLQIPPMDLEQVEVIKGASSALYGSSALGGVVNLISRRPSPERELLLNQTTLDGTDGVLWLADELGERWGYTFLGGLHRQREADVDDDGWSDVPGYRRAVLRPRLFWNDGAGKSLLVTAGATMEDRAGGTRGVSLAPDGTSFVESLDTRRGDLGLIGRFLIGQDRLLTIRGSAMLQRHGHVFGDQREDDAHSNGFGEVAYGGLAGGHNWLVGAALQVEDYRADDFSDFDFRHTVPSIFAQDEYVPVDWLTVAVSARLDRHNEYGTFANPRISILFRPGEWTSRFSIGTGYFAPTPFTEETEAVGLSRLAPLGDLEAETARGVSLDVGREFGEVEVNATLFGSLVENAIQGTLVDDRLQLVNATSSTRTAGGEILVRWHVEPFHVTATYTGIRATEPDPGSGGRREVPLTPRHAAGVVGMWEEEDQGRIGLEVYYTGRQELDANPYRTSSLPYVVTGLLVERRFSGARVFFNAENMLDVRQTGYDPLTLPARSPEGRWTTDAWAPLEGRVFNVGIRYEF